jgi:hypothetical protein
MSNNGDPFRKASGGDPLRIPAATWNCMIDAAKAFASRTRGDTSQDGSMLLQRGVIVTVKNDSDEDRDQFQVMGIDDSDFTHADNEDSFLTSTILKCITPTAEHRGKFVILRSPIAKGKYGQAFIAAMHLPVQISISADTDKAADVKDGDAKQLLGGGGSAQILWKEAETGDKKWALVRFPFGAGGTAVAPDDQSYDGEHVEAENDSTLSGLGWDRDNPKSGTDGARFSLVRGIAYYDSGDGKLYEWRQDFTIDSAGCMKSFSAPYRVTIEEPGACP